MFFAVGGVLILVLLIVAVARDQNAKKKPEVAWQYAGARAMDETRRRQAFGLLADLAVGVALAWGFFYIGLVAGQAPTQHRELFPWLYPPIVLFVGGVSARFWLVLHRDLIKDLRLACEALIADLEQFVSERKRMNVRDGDEFQRVRMETDAARKMAAMESYNRYREAAQIEATTQFTERFRVRIMEAREGLAHYKILSDHDRRWLHSETSAAVATYQIQTLMQAVQILRTR